MTGEGGTILGREKMNVHEIAIVRRITRNNII